MNAGSSLCQGILLFWFVVVAQHSLTTAFQGYVLYRPRSSLQTKRSLLHASSGKGFGTSSTPPPEKESEDFQRLNDNEQNTSGSSLNEGQAALIRMRREKAEQRDQELRKVKEVRSVDEFVRDDPSAAAIPEKVALRMGKRMLPFVGLPLFGGMGIFVMFWYLATYKSMEFQPSLVAGSTIAVLVIGLLGITYSMMSASWDPDREGTALGLDEFSKNVDNLKDGLSRSRENLVIREKMAGMPDEEIEAAIKDLDRRDAAKAKREQQQSLESKLDL